MLFCVPAGEISFVSNDLMREGIFNCILDYLYVYQKEKRDSHGWFTALEKPEFSHSFLAKS